MGLLNHDSDVLCRRKKAGKKERRFCQKKTGAGPPPSSPSCMPACTHQCQPAGRQTPPWRGARPTCTMGGWGKASAHKVRVWRGISAQGAGVARDQRSCQPCIRGLQPQSHTHWKYSNRRMGRNVKYRSRKRCECLQTAQCQVGRASVRVSVCGGSSGTSGIKQCSPHAPQPCCGLATVWLPTGWQQERTCCRRAAWAGAECARSRPPRDPAVTAALPAAGARCRSARWTDPAGC